MSSKKDNLQYIKRKNDFFIQNKQFYDYQSRKVLYFLILGQDERSRPYYSKKIDK